MLGLAAAVAALIHDRSGGGHVRIGGLIGLSKLVAGCPGLELERIVMVAASLSHPPPVFAAKEQARVVEAAVLKKARDVYVVIGGGAADVDQHGERSPAAAGSEVMDKGVLSLARGGPQILLGIEEQNGSRQRAQGAHGFLQGVDV